MNATQQRYEAAGTFTAASSYVTAVGLLGELGEAVELRAALQGTRSPVGEHVFDPEPAMRADELEWDVALLEHLDQVRIRALYDLRHTYATFALRAGVPVFAVSRFLGTSIAMIDRHYGHLAHDSHVHAASLLDALAFERAVDAAWTSTPSSANALEISDPKPFRGGAGRRVDARWTSKPNFVALIDNRRSRSAGTS